jgi:multiple RNA-binding domain-containing protein 1
MDSNLKRKREEKSQDPKLQEYLSVMGGSSKTRTWANDDEMIKPSAETAPVINQPVQEEEDEFQELPSHPKKAKTEKPAVVEKPEQPEPMVVDQSGEEESQEAPEQEQQEPEPESAPVSDADWLRSKTSRLLGLLDEDEQDEFEQHKTAAPPAAPVKAAPVKAAPAPSSPGDESPQRDEESRTMAFENVPNTTDDDSNNQPTPEDPNVDLIRNSARLFLRNLAYDTTDADLKPIFEKFGKLEEVSDAFPLCCCPIPSTSNWLVGFSACLPRVLV